MTHKYNVYIKDASSQIWEIHPKDFSIEDELNHESTADISLSFDELKRIVSQFSTDVMVVLTASIREIWIERDSSKIFWGVLTAFEASPTTQGEINIKLKAVDWFGILQRRICGIPKRVFSATDAGTIAWTLIDESQTSDNPYSDLGITMGSITASKNRDRTYRFDVIKDQIIALSNDNLDDGFDFDMDFTKKFNVYYPTKGSSRLNLVFDMTNLSGFSFKKPLIFDLANKVHVVGSGENDDVLYTTRTASTGYRSDWKTLEETAQFRQVEELATLQDHGDRILANKQTPIIEFEGQHYDDLIDWDDYGIGDTVKVNIPELAINNESKRVYKRGMDMQSDKSIGLIKITLK